MLYEYTFIVVGRTVSDFKSWLIDKQLGSKYPITRVRSHSFIYKNILYQYVSVEDVTALRGRSIDGIVIVDVPYIQRNLDNFLHNTLPSLRC